MRLIQDWQYKFIEKALYRYKELNPNFPSEKSMIEAIDLALVFFKGQMHETMIRSFYFGEGLDEKEYKSFGKYAYVCINILATEEPNGYVIRREIIYRIAMYCYGLGLFKIKENN